MQKDYHCTMKGLTPILTITGSDNTGGTGIQRDIKTITALGGHAETAITSITVQNDNGIEHIIDLSPEIVAGQTRAILYTCFPKAVKVGMVRNEETVSAVRNEIIGCRNIVTAPKILSSKGERLMDVEATEAWKKFLIPISSLLFIKCEDAEFFIGRKINTNEDMVYAAVSLCALGAKAVLLRGCVMQDGMITALLYCDGKKSFFTSHNTDGWLMHGVSGVMSTAIATRLAMGDDVESAVAAAHTYMHSQIIYATNDNRELRPADIYNSFLNLIAENYKDAHDVAFYADKLAISTRYLSQVTDKVVGVTPKQTISNYIMKEAMSMLETSRLPIQAISDSLGFSSQAQFCKFFIKQKGMSPSKFRSTI